MWFLLALEFLFCSLTDEKNVFFFFPSCTNTDFCNEQCIYLFIFLDLESKLGLISTRLFLISFCRSEMWDPRDDNLSADSYKPKEFSAAAPRQQDHTPGIAMLSCGYEFGLVSNKTPRLSQSSLISLTDQIPNFHSTSIVLLVYILRGYYTFYPYVGYSSEVIYFNVT